MVGLLDGRKVLRYPFTDTTDVWQTPSQPASHAALAKTRYAVHRAGNHTLGSKFQIFGSLNAVSTNVKCKPIFCTVLNTISQNTLLEINIAAAKYSSGSKRDCIVVDRRGVDHRVSDEQHTENFIVIKSKVNVTRPCSIKLERNLLSKTIFFFNWMILYFCKVANVPIPVWPFYEIYFAINVKCHFSVIFGFKSKLEAKKIRTIHDIWRCYCKVHRASKSVPLLFSL